MLPMRLLVASILPLAAFTKPLPVNHAGGPAIVPLPASCTVYNPLPHHDGFMPSPEFAEANHAYSAYFATWREPAAIALECVQQCHGILDCKSAFSGFRIPTPRGYYGSSGGSLQTACIMFTEYLAPGDFVPALGGQYQNISAANLVCP